jgi:RimJ/RimL family protein N-acetyltransferase
VNGALSEFNIRRYRATDIVPQFEAVRESIADVYPWLPWCHPNYSLGDSTIWVLSRDQAWNFGIDYSFVIEHALSGTLIGGIGLSGINRSHLFGNLDYWVRSSWVRRGAATSAVLQIAQFGFTFFPLQRIEIIIIPENIASLRVAEKSKAAREGVLKNRIFLHGKSRDAVMYSLVPESQ